MAPAPTRSGRRRPSTSSSSDRTRTILIVALVLAAAIAGYLLWRAHSSSASTLDSSGDPGPDRTGSSSNLAPSGGAAGGDAGQLPVNLVSQPDQTQQQVQTFDTTPQAVAEAPTTTSQGYSYVNPRPGQTTPDYFEVGSQYYQQSAPGSDAYVPLPPSHPGVVGGASTLPDAFQGTNVRRPGVQLD